MSGAMLGAAFFKMLRLGRQAAAAAVVAQDEAEAAACEVVPWEEQWNADDEHAGVASEGAVLVGKDAECADDGTLASRYAKFTGERLETPLYTVVLGADAKAEAELCSVLGHAFSRVIGYEKGSDLRNSAALMQAVTDATAYQVEGVYSVMHRPLYNMHRQFGFSYGVDTSHTVYHGTSKVSAKSIVMTGFKGSANRRTKFGMGTYVTPDALHANAYAAPDEGTQEVLVAEVMRGPTGLGSPDLVR